MYCCGINLLFVFSLLIIAVKSVRIDWAKFLEDELLDDKLRLLGPEALLKNRQIFVKNVNNAVNRSCFQDLHIYEQAINKRESWALKMLDASSKMPTGLLQGHVIDMGMYDECIDIKGKSKDININGRHCMYSINPTFNNKHFPYNPTLSICLPESCTADDVAGLVNQTISVNGKLRDLGISVASTTCSKVDDSSTADDRFNIYIAGLFIYLGFLYLCTLCDIIVRHFGPVESVELTRFSLIKNAETILNMKFQDDDIPVIHGIRALSTVWIVLVHEFFFRLFGVNVNALDIPKWYSSWSALIPLLGVFTVDTFFTLSGFLVAYRFFKQMQKNNKFNPLSYYLHRFIRLTPPVAVIILLTHTIIPNVVSGARIDFLKNLFLSSCQSKWWSILLYIQNFVERDNFCLLHLWSLAVDMQLFWISPLILYPLYKKPKIGLLILSLLFVISVIVSALIIAVKRYPAIYFSHEPDIPMILDAFKYNYVMPYTRAAPWLLGILLGYEVTQKNLKPNKAMLNIGWLLAFVAFVFCTLGIKSFTNLNYEYNLAWESIFAALSKPLWSFIICWIIYTSIHDSSGIISSILSWKIFLPLSRLSYCIYLVHLIFPILEVGASRAPIFFNNFYIIHSFVGNMGIAIVCGFFFSILFEMPMLVLENTIFKRKLALTNEKHKIT